MARWLADQVGETGTVLGTDINVDWIGADMPQHVEIRRHDVTSDEIPASAYDLIHARLVLLHLPERDTIIPRLVGALRPGGWLVLEEFHASMPPCPEAATEDERTFVRVRVAFVELLRRREADVWSYPQALPWRLKRSGLVDVGAEGLLTFARGRSPGAGLFRANLLQVGDQAVQAGLISAEDLDTFGRLLDDPEFMFAMPLLVSAWGRRGPAGG